MRFRNFLASALIALAAASCGENGQPGAATKADLGQNATANSQTTALDPSKVQPPAPPSDAQWTILCDTLQGSAHVAEAGMRKSQLIQTSGMTDWYVIHGETESNIYYGYYCSLDDPAEKRRAEADRTRIASLTDRLGNPVVRGCILQPIAAADPQAPPAWNLLNTPKDAYWTIEIAAFAGDPKRKEAAVDMVRKIRQEGNPAYYYHGPTASSVCIGAWPRGAVAEQGTGITHNGAVRDDAHTQSTDTPLLVLADVAPPNMPGRIIDPKTGKAMTVEAQKLDVLDPDMKKMIAEYPDHMVNYKYYGVQNNGQTFPDPSVLVVIPHDQGLAQDGDLGQNALAPTRQQPVQPAAPTSPGDSVLRSIGDAK